VLMKPAQASSESCRLEVHNQIPRASKWSGYIKVIVRIPGAAEDIATQKPHKLALTLADPS
jgi:hypothetical protein